MSNIDFRTGALNGRLGGMVGASWKGIDYVRKMVVPFNPQSAGQQGTRTVFADLVEMGRRINSTILKDYILPKPKKMSPFNKFISNNQPLIDSGVYTIADVVISKGSLFIPPTVAIAAGAANNQVTVTWSATKQGEALDTDKILIVVFNATQNLYAFETSKTRVDATASISINESSGDVMHVWLFATQGDTLASDTAYDTDTVV